MHLNVWPENSAKKNAVAKRPAFKATAVKTSLELKKFLKKLV